MEKIFRCILVCCAMVFLFYRCSKIKNVFRKEDPRAAYLKKIESSPLSSKPMVQQWQAAADSVLQQAVPINLPFKTKIVYFIDEANALAWQFSLSKGRAFRLKLNNRNTSQKVFTELFSAGKGKPQLVKATDDSVLTFTASRNQQFVLRVQAELLVSGSTTIKLVAGPSFWDL